MNYELGCLDRLSDKKDERDYQLASILPKMRNVPVEFIIQDLSKVGRQNYGSCTSWAAVNGVKEYQEGKNLSEYFNYVNSKKISGIYNQQGEHLKNALKAVCDYGVCESAFFYDVKTPTWEEYIRREPTVVAYEDAKKYKGKKYWVVGREPQSFKEALFLYKSPVAFVMQWYKSYNACKGNLPMPDKWVGNHAVCAIGYTKEHLIVKNSWGEGWGDKGYFYIPFSDWKKHYIFNCWVLIDKDKVMTNVKLVKKGTEIGFYLPAMNQESLRAMAMNFGIEIPLKEDQVSVDWDKLKVDYELKEIETN